MALPIDIATPNVKTQLFRQAAGSRSSFSTNGVLVLPIHYASKLGKIKLAELPWAKMPGSGWAKLDATQTLTLLLNYLKQVLAIPFNHELIEQLENSVLVTEQFLNVAPKSHHNELSLQNNL